jgi:hypothetical protein
MKKNTIHLVILLVLSAICMEGHAQSSNFQASNFDLIGMSSVNKYSLQSDLPSLNYSNSNERIIHLEPNSLQDSHFSHSIESLNNMKMKTLNRRQVYSSLWAFASLNYLYADLVQFMDKEEHLKYHSGTVNGFDMSPGFIAGSVVFMQIAIANVFLPHVIKNDRTLRWVQIASGAIMTLVQSATLFVTQPTPYYAVLSGFEIAATAYITIDAIRWKPGRAMR